MTLAEHDSPALAAAAFPAGAVEPPSDDAALLDFLRERDVACPLCGYNLRGLTSPRCPECGRALQLSVGLVEPRIGAWVTCLVAVTAAGGLGVLLIMSTIANGWPGEGEGLFELMAMIYFLAGVPLVPALIFFRRRYMRLSQATQWSLGFAAIALTVLAYGALVGQ